MSVQKDILEVLSQRDQPVKTSELAEILKKTTSTIRGETTRLKQKDLIEGDSQEGWTIADAAKKQLEKGEIHPTMIEEEVTPRQQFEAIGRRIIGLKEDTVILATDIVWSGDFEDITWVYEALRQANIANDLRRVWANSWRAKLQKGIPPELETELTGASKAEDKAEEKAVKVAAGGREYIIVDDEPVRVGVNLGDYSLQDAKDILAIRALRNRFAGAGQQGGGAQSGTAEKVSDILTALSPYLNKDSTSDIGTLKEILADKLELQKQDILSRMPQDQGQKTFIQQLTELSATMKDIGPIIKSMLGIPEAQAPSTATPIQLTDKDGNPMVMDLTSFITVKKFEGEERRADAEEKRKEETAKEFRGLLKHAGKAAERFGSRNE